MKAVIIYSGGMDSFTLFHNMLRDSTIEVVCALSFNYNQKHRKELAYAQRECINAGVPHEMIFLPTLQGSTLTNSDEPIPEGHYADESMRKTFVPNRNMVMLSYAVARAIALGAERVYYGAHMGDHAIYPDCRPEFLHAFNAAAQMGNYEPIEVVAPYMQWDKSEILEAGLKMGLDYSRSWTCYNGRDKPCGKCGSCCERLEAFADNNTKDPLVYENA
jgi:7-cyano-7-deazaguanine synthase